jgi:hypothetical protein
MLRIIHAHPDPCSEPSMLRIMLTLCSPQPMLKIIHAHLISCSEPSMLRIMPTSEPSMLRIIPQPMRRSSMPNAHLNPCSEPSMLRIVLTSIHDQSEPPLERLYAISPPSSLNSVSCSILSKQAGVCVCFYVCACVGVCVCMCVRACMYVYVY